MKTPTPSNTPCAISEEEAARFLGISRSSLRKGRMPSRRAAQMSSPPFVKMGRRVLYLVDDLEQWLQGLRHDAERAGKARS